MATREKPYRRLPGKSSNLVEHIRLYLAADHLLQVSSTGFTESYRRFYFRDIQSMTLRKTRTGLIWNIVLSVVVAPALLFAVGLLTRLAPGDVPAGMGWGVTAFLFGLPLLINLALGPTCVCQIQTAVQTRRLPTLGRLRRARNVIAQIKPLIEAAQGPLPPTEIAARLDAARQGTVADFGAPAVVEPSAPSTPAAEP